MKFSEKIIQARKAKALTQEDLAEAVGVSRQSVSKWETEEAKPDLDKLVSICKVLDLSMDYLCLDKQPEITVELPQPQKVRKAPYLISGACIGLVAAMLVGLFSMGLHKQQEEPAIPQTTQTTTTTVPAETKPDYSAMLANLKVSDAKWEFAGWHVIRVTFVPSLQIPGMQVRFAVRDHVSGKTEYLDAIRQGAGYVVDFSTPATAYNVDVIAVCSVGELSVQFALFNYLSEDGSSSVSKTLWENE